MCVLCVCCLCVVCVLCVCCVCVFVCVCVCVCVCVVCVLCVCCVCVCVVCVCVCVCVCVYVCVVCVCMCVCVCVVCVCVVCVVCVCCMCVLYVCVVCGVCERGREEGGGIVAVFIGLNTIMEEVCHCSDMNEVFLLHICPLRVMVQMTAGVNVTKFIHTTTEQGASSVQGNCTNSNSTLPPLNFNQFAARGFQINWCLYTLKCIEEITASETPPTIRIAPPIPRRNSVLTLIVIVAVMCVLLTMTLTGLTCFFFGRRKHS